MRTEEFIKKVISLTKEEVRFEEVRKGLPLGLDVNGGVVIAQKQEKTLTVKNTCVSGPNRTNFIRRFLIALSCLYEKDEACFFVLSPHTEYGELLRLHSLDITVPYIREKSDLKACMETIQELIRQRDFGKGYPKLFIVLDGLEELEESNVNGDLAEYRAIFDLLMRRSDVQIITGVDLTRSIFSGFPGAFLGIGNCLVSIREAGKADVTYVNDDSSLTMPEPIGYPIEPTVMESIIYLNAAFPAEK